MVLAWLKSVAVSSLSFAVGSLVGFAVAPCVVHATGSATLTTAARTAWTLVDWMLNLCSFEGGSFVVLVLFLGVPRVVRTCYCWLAIVCS